MRIAYIVTRADAVGGATVHVMELAGAMRERGHEVLVLVGGSGPVTDRLAAARIPFHSLRFLRRPVNPLWDLLCLREATGALRQFAPHLVSTHTAKAGWIGRAAAAWLGIPVLYTPHGLPVGDRMPGTRGRLFQVAERAAARWTSAIVCVSESERQLALEHGIGTPEQLVVVHNGVRDVAPELRASPGSSPVRIVSVARFEDPKDHAGLLRALAALGCNTWEIDLVGDGPLEPCCRSLAARLGIADRVHFLGYLPEVAPVLARAQIFALSSRSEGLPRSVLEAMRAGLPVVASDVGGISEAVDNGISGCLVPGGDEGRLSAALGCLIADRCERQRLGNRARLSYDERFRLERMVEKTAGVYEMAVGPDARKRSHRQIRRIPD